MHAQKTKAHEKNKSYSLSKYNVFVDDNLIPEIKTHMQQAMAPSIKALFMALAPDLILIYRSNISMNKFYQEKCSYVRHSLTFPSTQEQSWLHYLKISSMN